MVFLGGTDARLQESLSVRPLRIFNYPYQAHPSIGLIPTFTFYFAIVLYENYRSFINFIVNLFFAIHAVSFKLVRVPLLFPVQIKCILIDLLPVIDCYHIELSLHTKYVTVMQIRCEFVCAIQPCCIDEADIFLAHSRFLTRFMMNEKYIQLSYCFTVILQSPIGKTLF